MKILKQRQEHIIYIYAGDSNEDVRNTKYVVSPYMLFDNTAPTITSNSESITKLVNNSVFKFNVKEEHSGLGSLKLKYVKDKDSRATTNEVSITVKNTTEYEYDFGKEISKGIYVCVIAVDKADNLGTGCYSLNIDNLSINAFDKDGKALDKIPNISKVKPRVENKVIYEVEEIVDIEVEEDKAILVVNEEEVRDIKVSVNEEEYKEMDTNVIELSGSEVVVINIKFSYANEELKKLFVLNKKNNTWVVSKR